MKYSAAFFCFVLLFFERAYAQTPLRPEYAWMEGRSYTASKNYYLISLLETLPELRRAIQSDPVLSRLSGEKRMHLTEALERGGIVTPIRREDVFTDIIVFDAIPTVIPPRQDRSG